MIRPPVKGGTTPHGTCLSCLLPMRKWDEKPDHYPFKTAQRSNDLQCNYCRSRGRAPVVYTPPKADKPVDMQVHDLRNWYAEFCLDRARRGIPAEGTYFEGEEPNRVTRKAGMA